MRKKSVPNRSDGYYEIKIVTGRDINGKLIRKSFYSTISKKDAEEKAKIWQIEHEAAEMVGSIDNIKSIGFSEWADKWLSVYKESKVKITTYKSSYERPTNLCLKPYFKNTPLTQIKPVDISKFYSIIENKYSKSYCGKVKLCINAIFNTAIDNDYCSKNPCRNAKLSSTIEKHEKRTYTQQEVDSIIDFSYKHKYGLSIHILLEWGLRCSELLGLYWEDVNIEKKEVYIQRTIVDNAGIILPSDLTKSDTSNRHLPISQKIIDHYSVERNNATGYMITSTKKKGQPLNNKAFTQKRYQTFFKAYRNYINNPDFRILTPHELRHTCGTLLYERTHDIYAVSKYLGHASIEITTKYYVHQDAELLRSTLGID